MPPWEKMGVPMYFHSSTISGSAAWMSARTLASVCPRQSPRSSILASIFAEADSAAMDFFMVGSNDFSVARSTDPAMARKERDARAHTQLVETPPRSARLPDKAEIETQQKENGMYDSAYETDFRRLHNVCSKQRDRRVDHPEIKLRAGADKKRARQKLSEISVTHRQIKRRDTHHDDSRYKN